MSLYLLIWWSAAIWQQIELNPSLICGSTQCLPRVSQRHLSGKPNFLKTNSLRMIRLTVTMRFRLILHHTYMTSYKVGLVSSKPWVCFLFQVCLLHPKSLFCVEASLSLDKSRTPGELWCTDKVFVTLRSISQLSLWSTFGFCKNKWT